MLKTTRDFVQLHQEIDIALRSFGSRIQSLEVQIAQAAQRLKAARFRHAFNKSLKDEIDRRCGRTKSGKQQVTKLEGETGRIGIQPPVNAPRSSEPATCAILDRPEGMDLAIEDPAQFEALLTRCRGRRN